MEENIQEIVYFVIDEDRSTENSKFVKRKRKVVHKDLNDKETSVEIFEDTFTIPLHKFNLNLILSQTKIQNIEETLIVQRNIKKKKVNEDVVEIEVINLPTDSVNLETVLPMIDHTDICSFVISEVRRQIVRKDVSTVQVITALSIKSQDKSSSKTSKEKKDVEADAIPDLETVEVRSKFLLNVEIIMSGQDHETNSVRGVARHEGVGANC